MEDEEHAGVVPIVTPSSAKLRRELDDVLFRGMDDRPYGVRGGVGDSGPSVGDI